MALSTGRQQGRSASSGEGPCAAPHEPFIPRKSSEDATTEGQGGAGGFHRAPSGPPRPGRPHPCPGATEAFVTAADSGKERKPWRRPADRCLPGLEGPGPGEAGQTRTNSSEEKPITQERRVWETEREGFSLGAGSRRRWPTSPPPARWMRRVF